MSMASRASGSRSAQRQRRLKANSGRSRMARFSRISRISQKRMGHTEAEGVRFRSTQRLNGGGWPVVPPAAAGLNRQDDRLGAREQPGAQIECHCQHNANRQHCAQPKHQPVVSLVSVLVHYRTFRGGQGTQGIVMDACVQCFTPAANRQSRLMRCLRRRPGSGRRLLPALAAVPGRGLADSAAWYR